VIRTSDIRRELQEIPEEEREDLVILGGRLIGSRPAPRAAFRAELRQRLGLSSGHVSAPRPERLRVLIASYVGSGLLLLGVGAVGLAGFGPFAA
jgi:hypothetical protein